MAAAAEERAAAADRHRAFTRQLKGDVDALEEKLGGLERQASLFRIWCSNSSSACVYLPAFLMLLLDGHVLSTVFIAKTCRAPARAVVEYTKHRARRATLTMADYMRTKVSLVRPIYQQVGRFHEGRDRDCVVARAESARELKKAREAWMTAEKVGGEATLENFVLSLCGLE